MTNWTTVRRQFAADQRAAGLSPRTIAARDELLRRLSEHAGVGPLQIVKGDLVEYLTRPNARTGGPLSAGTIQVERSYLQVWGAWMVEEGIRADDPARRLRKVKVPRRRPRPLRLEHIDLMLTSRSWSTTRDLIAVAAMSGLRVGEVVRIRGEDVDWVTHRIRSIRKGKLDHSLPMPPALIEIAKRMPAKGWWFPSKRPNAEFPDGGGHILMKSASTRISIVLRKVGIVDPAVTAHSLRHFYATTLLRQGVNIRVVQEMMGHASLATTQMYTEVTDDEIDDAARVLPTIDPRARRTRVSGRLAA